MLLTEDCFGNLRSNSNLRRRQANTIDSSLSIQGLKTRWHLLICSTGVDTVSLKLITTLFSVRTRYAGKNSRASTVVVTLKALSKRSRWEGCCRGPVNEIQQQRPRECWWLRCQNSGRASAVEGVGACCGIRKVMTGPVIAKQRREGTPHGTSAKDSAIGIWMQAWKIGARFLAVKTGKELGAFNKEVPADRISHDSIPQPMLCEAVSAYRQKASAHS